MASGIQFPVHADISGRMAVESGEAQLAKIIILNLSDDESANPFQDLGIGSEIIFNVSDDNARSRISRRIVLVFARLQAQGRAILSPGYPRFEVDSATQEMTAELRYISLESMTEQELQLVFEGALARLRGY